MHKNSILEMLLLVLAFVSVKGQEPISLHTDKPFYVAGERIWFSAYVLGGQGKAISEGNMLISLYDQSGRKVHDHLVAIEEGKAVGDMYLDEVLETGNYLLRFVSPDVKVGQMYVQDAILPILHPSLLQNIRISEATSEPLFSGEIPSSSLGAGVKLSTFSPGASQSVELDIPGGANANISVVVRHLSQVGTEEITWLPGSFVSQSSLLEQNSDSWNVSAGLSKPDGGIIPATVNAYWVEQDSQILAKVSEGKLMLTLPKRSGTQHFQLLDASPFPDHNFQAEWNQLSDLEIPLPNIPKMGELSEVQKNYLYWSQRRKLVERLFQISALEAVEEDQTLVRTKPDKSYSSQKYLAFKDLEAFFKEVLSPAVKVVNTKEGKSIRMLNFDSRVRFTQPPLIFLDDYLMKDITQLWEINWNNVDYMEVFGSHEAIFPRFGPMGQGRGVLRLFTKGRQDFTGKIDFLPTYELEAYASKNRFFISESNQETPDLRPILFWDGEMKLTEEGKLRLDFPQSDLRGDFLIEIKGLSSTNTIFEAYHTYSVE
ncbi:MAG: hypothetical protein AAGC85_02045 [Bacteroidota bacterium]